MRRLIVPVLLLLAAACSPGGSSEELPPDSDVAPADTAGLARTHWVLAELPGIADIAGNGGRMPDLQFGEDGNAGGFSGCNSMGGPYTVSGSSLNFGPMAMTMMACEQGMEVERAYADALERVTRYRRSGNTLELMDGEGVVARFTERTGE